MHITTTRNTTTITRRHLSIITRIIKRMDLIIITMSTESNKFQTGAITRITIQRNVLHHPLLIAGAIITRGGLIIITTTGINNKTIIIRSITSTIVKTRTVCLLPAQIHHHKITTVVGTDIVSTHKNCQICCNAFLLLPVPRYVVSWEFLFCALE
jgi:hypothetical protein